MSSLICDRSLASPAQFNLVITISFALVPIFSFALSIIEKNIPSNFKLQTDFVAKSTCCSSVSCLVSFFSLILDGQHQIFDSKIFLFLSFSFSCWIFRLPGTFRRMTMWAAEHSMCSTTCLLPVDGTTDWRKQPPLSRSFQEDQRVSRCDMRFRACVVVVVVIVRDVPVGSFFFLKNWR